MTRPHLHCGHAFLPVGARIGRGGEGEIYRVADGSGRAVKIYLNPDLAREVKVRAMIASRLAEACPNVAFPRDLVRHADSRFAGFTMAEIRDHEPIHELIGGRSRRRYFPQAGWPFLVRTAINVGRAVASVHAAGIVIGDINSSGILVAQDATVKLIDADSFQIGSHRCRVGMPEYTPPELQGVHLGELDRTRDHDAFGLAVMLFQLLMLGRHPFTCIARGRPDPIEKAIGNRRFAYSELRQMGVSPPPYTMRLSDLPRAIRFAFERAFALPGHLRPTAAEWVQELVRLEGSLAPCPNDSRHILSSPSAPCPWCRIERETGRPTFHHYVQAPTVRKATQSIALRQDVLHAIGNAKHEAGENILPRWHRAPAKPSKAARTLYVNQAQGPGSAMSPALRVLGFSTNIPIGFVPERHATQVEAERRLDEWRTRLGYRDVLKACHDLLRMVGDMERYQTHRQSLLARALTRITGLFVNRIMVGYPIAGARLAGIGTALQAQLASRGITQAAHIYREKLAEVPGLGERRIVALLFWRESIAVAAEREASGSSAAMASAADAAADEVDRHIADVEASIRRGLVDLASMVSRVRAAASIVDTKLEHALAKRDQALSDLSLLGIAADPRHAAPAVYISPSVPPAKTRKRKSKPASGRKPGTGCPLCGGRMIKRWAHAAAGSSAVYLGCSSYPRCNGRRPSRSGKTAP